MRYKIALVIYTMVLITSCKQHSKTPDVTSVPVKLTLNRFEIDLFQIDIHQPAESIAKLKAKYGHFFDIYLFQITSLGSADSSIIQERLLSFVQDTNFRKVFIDCQKTFGDFSGEKIGLTKAFQFYKYYFPKKTIPEVVTLISGFSYPIVCDSFHLGISLDMYLGKDYRFYSTLEPPLPNYLRVQMVKENVVVDAMKGWAMSDYQVDESVANVMMMMVSDGRIVSFLEKILPEVEVEKRLGFTKAQLEWCQKNEKNIWQFFIQNKLLFSADPNILSKYTNEGPTTNGFPKESPGNIGKYIGWKIIQAYEKKFPDVDLQKLMEEKDLVKIYQQSNYKPE